MPRSYGRAPRRLMAAVLACLLMHACLAPALAAPAAPYSALFNHRALIRKGDRGDLVRDLQEVLSGLGYKTQADGVFGDGTKASLKKFQADHDLHADGIAGTSTLSALSTRYYRKYPPETHTVKAGETLSIIGDRYGMSVDALAGINRLSNPNSIYAGQVIFLKENPSWSEPQVPTGIDPNPGPSEGSGAAVLLPEPALPAPTKRVCLSFDDGPDVYTTRQILSVLKTYGIRATFFLIGDRAARNPDLVQEIAGAGHVIGVHGYDHKTLSGLSATEVRKDLKKAQDAIAGITGQKPHLYRPPGGFLDRTQVDEAEKLGLTTLMWTNIGGADLGAASAEEVTYRVTQAAKDGGIILLHEGLQHTLEALPSIIETLARLGFGFQNVSLATPR